jgi:hypothetical protein
MQVYDPISTQHLLVAKSETAAVAVAACVCNRPILHAAVSALHPAIGATSRQFGLLLLDIQSSRVVRRGSAPSWRLWASRYDDQ